MSDYKILRRVEYPSVHDFLEALHDKEKGDDTKYNAWIAACDKVKTDFPKGD
tara:strand:- start:2083 stop:2238 length:156 start_codon:yes stop_codon:yes gene_type:complete